MTETGILITIIGALFTTLTGIIAWNLSKSIGKLDSIAASLGNIEKDLGILANDHSNLKKGHDELKNRVDLLFQYHKKN